MFVIETKNLTKSYGKNRGIDNINLQVEEGEIYGFVGPNGAGKSTTIRTLLGFVYGTSGEAKIFGKDIVKEGKQIKKILGYVPSEVKFYDDVKVRDIINYSISFYDHCNKEDIDKLCNIFEVELDKKMGELSLGNKKKVALVQAFVHKPKLLILDEPTNGLDPLIQKKLFDYLVNERKRGTTIFLSSHNLVEVENFCDRVAVIKEGKIVDIIEIDKIDKSGKINVTIVGDEITKEILEKIGASNINKISEKFTFSYSGDVNILIRDLSKYKLKQLLISEQSLEDIFMHYYKREGEK